VSIPLNGLVALAKFSELIRLTLQRGFWDVVAAKLFHELIQVMAEGSLAAAQ
jgi:hypothetical protein